MQARQWWEDLAALVARPGVRAGDAAALAAELRGRFEAYPELLKAALLEGHVLAVSNGDHCPAALRCVPTPPELRAAGGRAASWRARAARSLFLELLPPSQFPQLRANRIQMICHHPAVQALNPSTRSRRRLPFMFAATALNRWRLQARIPRLSAIQIRHA